MTKIKKSRLAPKNIPNGYFYKKNSTAELEVQFIVFVHKTIKKKPETDRDDTPGEPRRVIPVRFGFLLALFGQKTPKRTGMTNLGFPGLSSQSVSGFFGPFRPENLETDWDDKPGLPRLVIQVRFRVFWPFSTRKPRNGLG